MKLIEQTVTDFCNLVDSKEAVPGGGSVAALSSSLGASLGGMVAKLTITKKKFLALDETIQMEFHKKAETINKIKQELMTLVDKDTEAYQLIMDAYKLPKNTDEELKLRNEKILEGSKVAIKIPFHVAMLSIEALELLEFIVKYGNQSAASDLGVASLMLCSGLEGAILNVKTNLPMLDLEITKQFYANNVSDMLVKAKTIKGNILKIVEEKMK
ncbi:MAG: formimidoyltetrahydrofolate cyclodeaminase [Tenericutes bacterium HGW-Tenericutes-1]|jgi:formiminotetrahydrofolate cyclodeaminase|nr:MAG: formimidoyltetrahydrofolate cyclodeaminase [Tenericutes bacterium HGW-Tenericutes-1]